MGCNTRTVELTRRVWTGHSTADPVFIPLLTLPVNQVGTARISFVVFEGTGDVKVRRRVRYSDDGFTFDGLTTFQSDTWVEPASPAAWQYGDDYYAPSDTRQIVQYGIEAVNVDLDPVDALARAVVSFRVEIRDP